MPGSFDTGEFESDVNLLAALTDINTVVAQFASQVDDTRLAVGGEAMTGGIQVYKYVQAAVKTTPGLKPVADQLGERFKKAQTPPATPPQP